LKGGGGHSKCSVSGNNRFRSVMEMLYSLLVSSLVCVVCFVLCVVSCGCCLLRLVGFVLSKLELDSWITVDIFVEQV